MMQGTDEWRQARLGKVTASRIADVVARTRTGPAASRTNYMAELIAERLTGVPADSYVNGAMQWGLDHEAEAADAYCFYIGLAVEQVGFVDHPSIQMSGASPDRLAGAGLLEIKCPNTATHIDTILGKAVPAKYVAQMQWQMACTDRQWCDFASYDPRMPEELRLFVQRLPRDDSFICDLEIDVRKFLAELDGKIELLALRRAA